MRVACRCFDTVPTMAMSACERANTMARSCSPCAHQQFLPGEQKSLNSLIFLVGVVRFELTTLCSQSRCATRLRHTPPRGFIRDDGGFGNAAPMA